MSVDFSSRWVNCHVHTGVIAHNVATLARHVAPSEVWVVVKANGYGHGAVEVARAALSAGATGLCVAIVDEGVALRRYGITAPILLLSEQPADVADMVVGYMLTATVTTTRGAAALAAAAASADLRAKVHVKVDTGMHRVGVSPGEALALAQFVRSHESLEIDGVYTHLAAAEMTDNPATARQLGIFDEVVATLAAHGITPRLVHAANSAGALAHPESRRSLVRAGIAVYGLSAGAEVDGLISGLVPALTLRARVSAVRWVEAGEAVSYGLRRPLKTSSLIATVPIGYADGVPRRLGETDIPVLIGGVPRPIAGTVTMDQMLVDCGTDSSVTVGDEVVLIGRQGDNVVTADQWADALGTIGYEIVCGISSRVHRTYQ